MSDIATPPNEPAAVAWFKSSHSGGEGNECVEIANFRTGVALRDSKLPDGSTLTVSTGAFAAFIGSVRKGDCGPSLL
ncbi:DUF397 domain-containing protein [Streptomyces cahuitamycinicus]|uniref:DUF397 domain-containing protein n=1 Tax=Streptomyces cahuitamycinicus TaxID=2070367 RepID=A0A2N8TRP3_9ACTN|nr:DUF397 domain-containing protein [Streptomyces cahuitamycinicus]PNG21697.1 DUF397 domain-containing protein [Streptomyces cahuitamycinicus]